MGTYVTAKKESRILQRGPAARRARIPRTGPTAHEAPRAVVHTLVGKEKSPI
ncbi:MAG TPA: hypothetical protein PKI19_06150 [Elusimicrobiales bacterium]|nr:hypothetical protein [Elusimicrobiales bacterium]